MWLLIFLGISAISSFHCQVEGKKVEPIEEEMEEVHEDENEIEEDENNEEGVYEEEGEEVGDEEEDEELGDEEEYEEEGDEEDEEMDGDEEEDEMDGDEEEDEMEGDEEDEEMEGDEEEEEEVDCNPLQPNALQPRDCCSVKLFPKQFVKGSKICLHEAPDLKDDLPCLMECVFAFGELLTNKNKLNIKKVKTAFYHDKGAPGAQSINRIIDHSLEVNPEVHTALTSKGAKCKSGAFEFSLTIMREVFLHCPAKLQDQSDECFTLGVKVHNCQSLPVFM